MTVSDCHSDKFVIAIDEELRNLLQQEFRVLIKEIFRLRCATLNMIGSDFHSDKFVISMDEGLRNLYKKELEF